MTTDMPDGTGADRPRLVLCDCAGSMAIDRDALAAATGHPVSRVHDALCTRQLDAAAAAIRDGDAVMCCAQEAGRWAALAAEIGAPPPPALDLRDRAGWTDPSAGPSPDTTPDTTPKMTALVALAALPRAAPKVVDVASGGRCLILGAPDAALAAAVRLKDHLGVTVLLPDGTAPAPGDGFDVVTGTLRRLTGAFGRFEVRIDRFRQIDPTGRGARGLTDARDGAISDCDLVLDLTGGPSLLPAPDERDGYLRADPAAPGAVADAVLAASHLVGTFEKVLHVRTEPILCAHSRATQTGCTRCLDLCPTGAIAPAGEHVAVDPLVCAGCGACSAVCPSGAVSYDAPPVDETMRAVQTLARAYRDAGGGAPRLLVHDAHGAEMIRLAARHGRGLPVDVVPFEIDAVAAFGHAEMLAALAAGFARVTMLPAPRTDRAALGAQVDLARALGGDGTADVLDTPDPDAMADALYEADAPAAPAGSVRPIGTRRQIARRATAALRGETVLPLPDGAPYGAVLVDADACTLCLSCVSLCPSGALGDNPDRPELRFQEDACLQCGLCANVCPEDAITLRPRMDTTPAALSQRVLHEEEPFACISCGAAFGVRSTVEKVTAKLTGHAMFADAPQLQLIQMCDDCRVKAQYHAGGAPFAGAPRPRVRTTDDDLAERDGVAPPAKPRTH